MEGEEWDIPERGKQNEIRRVQLCLCFPDAPVYFAHSFSSRKKEIQIEFRLTKCERNSFSGIIRIHLLAFVKKRELRDYGAVLENSGFLVSGQSKLAERRGIMPASNWKGCLLYTSPSPRD